MVMLVTILGLVICVMAVVLLVKPAAYLRFAEKALESTPWYWSAIGLRIVFGVILMLAAPDTRFPGGIFWIGVIFVLAALAIVFSPKQKLRSLVSYWTDRPGAVRWLTSLVLIFGIYLVYATL